MALKDAVLLIASQMEEDSKIVSRAMEYSYKLTQYAQQLRVAVSAAEGPPHTRPVADGKLPFIVPEVQHEQMVAKAREEFRQRSGKEEQQAPSLVEIKGGPLDGDWISVAPNMTEGSRININGTVYRKMSDGCLHAEESNNEV